MSDTMTEMRARWIGKTVRWNQHLNTGTMQVVAVVIDMTPAELLVDIITGNGGRMWVSPDEDGFEVVEQGPAIEPGVRVQWVRRAIRNGRMQRSTRTGVVEAVDHAANCATIVDADTDAVTIVDGLDRLTAIEHPQADVRTAFVGERGAITPVATPNGIRFDVDVTGWGDTTHPVTLSFGVAQQLHAELGRMLYDQDHSAR